MNKHVMPKLTRRGFVIGTAAAGAGLAIGLDIPFGGPTVVRAAQQFGGSVVQAGEGIPASTLYQALTNGQPVVAWGSFDWKFHQVSHYVAFDGRNVQFGSPYEHTITLAGVTTDYVLVNNPWFGVQWITKPTFEAAYATFNRMAVIMGGRGGAPPAPSSTSTYSGTTPVPQDSYRPLPPTRILDTRYGTGSVKAPLGPSGTRDVQVTGAGGVPSSGVSSVVLNVTVTDTTSDSFLTVYPTGESLPNASNLNWIARQTVPNLVTVPVPAFTIAGASAASDSARVDLGSRLALNRFWELSGRVTGEFSNLGQSYSGMGSLRASW